MNGNQQKTFKVRTHDGSYRTIDKAAFFAFIENRPPRPWSPTVRLQMQDAALAAGEYLRAKDSAWTLDFLITPETRIEAEPITSRPDLGTCWRGDLEPERVLGFVDDLLALLNARAGLLTDEEVEQVRAAREYLLRDLPSKKYSVNRAGIAANTNDRRATIYGLQQVRDALAGGQQARHTSNANAKWNEKARDFWESRMHRS